MNILKFSRALQDPSEGVRMPTGILLAVPAVGCRAVHIYVHQRTLHYAAAGQTLDSPRDMSQNHFNIQIFIRKKCFCLERCCCEQSRNADDAKTFVLFFFILSPFFFFPPADIFSLLFLLTLSSSSFPHVTSHFSSFPHSIPVRFLFFVAWFVSCLVSRSYLSLLRCSDPHTCVFRVSEGSVDCASRLVSTNMQQSLRRCITKHLKASS